MSAEHVPSDQDIEDAYASTWLNCHNELGRERFREWLAAHDARVRRDAAREALDGLMVHAETREALALTGQEQIKWRHVRLAARNYGRAHYPEETP